MDWKYGSSSTVSALQALGPEFKPQSPTKKKISELGTSPYPCENRISEGAAQAQALSTVL
jgi:hypothetical protein